MLASFFDSNIPIYAAAGQEPKASIAEALMMQGGYVSVQVLNEVATVAQRKLKLPLHRVIDLLNRVRALATVVPLTVETHELALWVSDRHRFAFYDCCIVAAALLADCDTLWSEDLHDGLVIEGRLTIRNPFAG